MAKVRSVAIIGEGIGGLTAANSLIHSGLSVSLYERSPYFIPTAGAGVSLQPNGQISLAYVVIRTSDRLGEYGKRFGYFLGGALRAELVDILN